MRPPPRPRQEEMRVNGWSPCKNSTARPDHARGRPPRLISRMARHYHPRSLMQAPAALVARPGRKIVMSTATQDSAFDAAKAEAFAGRFLEAVNHGALCLMAAVGHRTGLFDAMSGLPPSTSAEIAKAAGLNERYVREWLG